MKFIWFLVIAAVGLILEYLVGQPKDMWGLVWRSALIGYVSFLLWLFSGYFWMPEHSSGDEPKAITVVVFLGLGVFIFGIVLFPLLGASALSAVATSYLLMSVVGMALIRT
jgi:hypothetical protein